MFTLALSWPSRVDPVQGWQGPLAQILRLRLQGTRTLYIGSGRLILPGSLGQATERGWGLLESLFWSAHEKAVLPFLTTKPAAHSCVHERKSSARVGKPVRLGPHPGAATYGLSGTGRATFLCLRFFSLKMDVSIVSICLSLGR